MKLKRIIPMLGLLSLLGVTSCSTEVDYKTNLDKYVVDSISYHDDFTVLQFTDIHWGTGTSRAYQEVYIKNLIKETENHLGKKVDLIVLTGDLFMLYNKETITSFIGFMDSLNIPFAPTWGNHDREGTVNANWFSEQFKSAKNCIYTEIDYDNLSGRGNYVINLKDSLDKTKTVWQLAMIDSGADIYPSGLSFTLTYDYIRKDQCDWLTMEHNLVGNSVPVVAYYHIPQYDNVYAFEHSATDSSIKSKYFKLEGFGNSKLDEALGNMLWFNTMKSNNVKAAFSGHAHANDITYTMEGVTIGLGVKTGTELYYGKITEEMAKEQGITDSNGNGVAFDLTGASLMTLHNDDTFTLEHLYYTEGKPAIWLEY